MDLKLDGKNAVVCGSTQGIGKAAAIELALLGADITLIARDEKKLKGVVKDLPTPLGQKHDYLVADFNFPELLQSGLEKHFSKEPIHILVNNTGGPAPGNGSHRDRVAGGPDHDRRAVGRRDPPSGTTGAGSVRCLE